MAFATVIAVSSWTAAESRAQGVEQILVPSAAMGRAIPVVFEAGGSHAVFLLDAFNAGAEVSNWVGEGDAMKTLAGKGSSVVAPDAGHHAPSMCSDGAFRPTGDGTRRGLDSLRTHQTAKAPAAPIAHDRLIQAQ